MHRIPGQNRLAGPAPGDHGFPGVGVYWVRGSGGGVRAKPLACRHGCFFFALFRAKPGALQNSGADQVGSLGFGRGRGAAAARDGLQQHLRKLPVLPVMLLPG